MWNCEGPRIAQTVEKEQSWNIHTLQFPNIVQSNSNQDSEVPG